MQHGSTGQRLRWRRVVAVVVGLAGLAATLLIRQSASSSGVKNGMFLLGFVFLLLAIWGAAVIPAWERLGTGPRKSGLREHDVKGSGTCLVVVRAGGFYKDRLIRYKLAVDGKPVGFVYEYDSLVVPIDPGYHSVQARAQVLFRSREVMVAVERHQTTHLVVAAGQVAEMPPASGYIRLWEGELLEVAPPAVGPTL